MSELFPRADDPLSAENLDLVATMMLGMCQGLGAGRSEILMLMMIGAAGVISGRSEQSPLETYPDLENQLAGIFMRGQNIGAAKRLGTPVIFEVAG